MKFLRKNVMDSRYSQNNSAIQQWINIDYIVDVGFGNYLFAKI